ncbi:MAG: hypothetical protein JWR28_361, partial [Modestobacter sp.]|nr:hypothetical protein [Modestobacter sp.]
MADQPTRSGADSGPPDGDRADGRSRAADGPPAAPLTVAELLARSGTGGVRRRRAERRESAEATGRQQPVDDDGRPGVRPPLRGGLRRDVAPSAGTPPVLPTGWQPAMPTPQAEPPADEPDRRPGGQPVESP